MLWISLLVSLSLSFSVLLPLSFSVSLSVIAWTFFYLSQPSNQPSRSLALNHRRRFPHHRHFPLLSSRPSLLSPHMSKGREVSYFTMIIVKLKHCYWQGSFFICLGNFGQMRKGFDLNCAICRPKFSRLVCRLDMYCAIFRPNSCRVHLRLCSFFILNECSFGYWARIRMAFPLLVWNVMDVCDSNF